MKRIRRCLRVAAPAGIALIFLFLLAQGCGRRGAVQIAILHTNDLHGHVLSEKVQAWPVPLGGYAVFASWVEKQRKENARRGIPTLLLDAGDIYSGTPEGNLNKGAAVVELMNAVGYDAMSLGNHEFDDGYYNLKELAKRASFPFLGANAVWKKSGAALDFARPYLLKEIEGLKIGIIGVVTPETGMITLSRHVDRIFFQPPVPAVSSCRDRLRAEGADLIVVLSHLGKEDDVALAREVDGLGVIIGGHSHDLIARPLREGKSRTLICQAGSYGRYAGRLDLWVDRATGEVRDYRYQIFVNREQVFPKDLAIDRLLDRIAAEVGPEYQQTIGLAIQDIASADRTESLLGDMICDAMREKTGTQIAFQNAYGIRAPLLAGDITRRDVFEVIPFEDQVVVMKLTGDQIKEVLEQSFSLKKGMLQVSGLSAGYDSAQPAGKRLTSLAIGGAPVEDGKEYTVATNGFLAAGGDYFPTFTRGKDAKETGVLLRDAFAEYLKAHSPFYRQDFAPSRLLPSRGSAGRD